MMNMRLYFSLFVLSALSASGLHLDSDSSLGAAKQGLLNVLELSLEHAQVFWHGVLEWQSSIVADRKSVDGAGRDDLLIATSLFPVLGTVSSESSRVRQFLGIPYAESPTGHLRFRPPATRKASNDVFNASVFGPLCYQHRMFHDTVTTRYLTGFEPEQGLLEDEDCLTLDIWAPRGGKHRQALGSAAVMIWIHGGALVSGSSSSPYMQGMRLVEAHQDIIVVSIKYTTHKLSHL